MVDDQSNRLQELVKINKHIKEEIKKNQDLKIPENS